MVSKIKKISWRNIVKSAYIYGILLLFIVIFFLVNNKFLSGPSLTNIIRTAAPLILVSVAVTMLMISGHVDLSVGSMLGFTGVVFALLAQAGVHIVWAALIVIIIGAALGALNGLLVVKLKIIPVIATLATMSVLLGVAKLLCGDTIPYVKGGLPDNFSFLGRGLFPGKIPFQLILIVVIVAVFILLQKKSVFGKYSMAIGGNRMAAVLSGINVNGMIWGLYMMVGAVTGLAGSVMASKLGIADATVGIGFELDVIIAVLLGGTSFFGGEGSVAGTVAGAFILTILGIGMNIIGIPPFYQYVVKGMVLILAIVLDHFVKERVAE
jgi:ribose/xylose/arabinose/galactoside ABC-type transport system permease subunit